MREGIAELVREGAIPLMMALARGSSDTEVSEATVLGHLFRGASLPTRTTLPGQKFDRSIEHTRKERKDPVLQVTDHFGRRYPERDRADGSL